MKRLLVLLLLATGLMISGSSYAQCFDVINYEGPVPTGPGAVPWSDNGCQSITISPNCVVELCFCLRSFTIDGKQHIQMYPYRVRITSGDCDGERIDIVLKKAIDQYIADKPCNFFPPCPNYYTVFEVAMGKCWKWTYYDDPVTQTTKQQWQPCPSLESYCLHSCRYCCDNGTVQISSCENVSFGAPGCTPIGNVENPTVNTCYDLSPCSWWPN